jgi:hypothetical protein
MFKKHLRIIISAVLLIMGGLISAQEGNTVINGIAPVDPVPFTPAEITINPGSLGDNTPSDFAPLPDACSFAAGSYVSAGMDAIRNTSAQFDTITYNNQDEDIMLYALYTLEATELFGSRVRFDDGQASNVVGDFFDGEVVVMGDESTCIETDAFTARLWELSTGEWVIDSIAFKEAIDLTAMWDVPAPANQGNLQIAQPDFPILVEGVVFRYLMPYIEPPITAVPLAGDQITSQPQAVCDNGAPSYLSVGMDVILSGYGYERFPADGQLGETEFALSNHGAEVYLDIFQTTPLVGIPGNIESELISPVDLYSGFSEPQATVVAGPICVDESVDPPIDMGNGILEASDPNPERFTTWWQIEVNGVTGWYPENVKQHSHWLWETDGIFARVLFLYYMIPASAAQQTTSCEPTRLYAGLDVQPISAMNLRSAPNGDVMGRINAGENLRLVGTPTCMGGAQWWQSDRGGFIAENDPNAEGYRGLLLPAVQNVAPQSTPITGESAPTVPQPVPTETPNNGSGTTPPTRPTEEPTVLPLTIITLEPTPTDPPRRQ